MANNVVISTLGYANPPLPAGNETEKLDDYFARVNQHRLEHL